MRRLLFFGAASTSWFIGHDARIAPSSTCENHSKISTETIPIYFSSFLNDLQRQIIEDLIFFMEYDKMGYDDEADEYEKEWFSKHPMIDTELRVATLAEMIRTFGFDADTNESLWFANFRFIDMFAFGH